MPTTKQMVSILLHENCSMPPDALAGSTATLMYSPNHKPKGYGIAKKSTSKFKCLLCCSVGIGNVLVMHRRRHYDKAQRTEVL